MKEFSQLDLHPSLVQRVSELGYASPTDVQAQVIPLMLSGKDIIAQSQTGSGKTAAFALPILHNLIEYGSFGFVQCLVLAPTRELAIQVADAIAEYGRGLDVGGKGVRVMPVYGGQHYGSSKRKIREGVDVIVGTPGRLQDLMRQDILDLSTVHTLVLDEADEMLSMGFIEDIENILREVPDRRQTTLFSATMPNPIRRLAEKYMQSPEAVTIARQQLTVDTVEQRYYLVNEKDKLAALTRLFDYEDITSAVIFTRTRASSSDLANELIQRGFPAEALNGDLNQEARLLVMNRFREGKLQVMVATDVAARGLDIDDISHVFNYDLPHDPEIYVHRIGRTGRAGKEGIAISLVTPGERRRLARIEQFTRKQLTQAAIPTEEDILQQRENLVLEKMEIWLGRGRGKREREMIEALMEKGHDPVDLATAALKLARLEERQRPIEPISEVVVGQARRERRNGYERKNGYERNNGYERKSREKRFEKSFDRPSPKRDFGKRDESHEDGMVRLSLSRGRSHGVKPAEVVGAIASQANIPGSVIGKILIRDQHTLVDVPEAFVSKVLGQTGAYRFHDQHYVTIERTS